MVGHAALFDTRAEIVPGFFEVISRGAFTAAIGRDDVRMLINHDPNLVLARTASGTLRLSEDEQGLACDADMASTSYGKDLAVSMGRGDISQMSFAFSAEAEDWAEMPNGDWLRTIRQAKLYDVSPVTYPAYDSTDASLRFPIRLRIPPLAKVPRARRKRKRSTGKPSARSCVVALAVLRRNRPK
jgi:hypothetical protein